MGDMSKEPLVDLEFEETLTEPARLSDILNGFIHTSDPRLPVTVFEAIDSGILSLKDGQRILTHYQGERREQLYANHARLALKGITKGLLNPGNKYINWYLQYGVDQHIFTKDDMDNAITRWEEKRYTKTQYMRKGDNIVFRNVMCGKQPWYKEPWRFLKRANSP